MDLRLFAAIFFVLLNLIGCATSNSDQSSDVGSSSDNGSGVQSANFTKNVFLDDVSSLTARAAFLTDTVALDNFFDTFLLPSSGTIELFHADGRGGCSQTCPLEKVVVDFAAGTATEYYPKTYTETYSEKGDVLAFDTKSGVFSNPSKARTSFGVENVKMLFLPVLAGDYAAIIRDEVFGWEHLSSEITMPSSMPTSGNATYTGDGIFDIRETFGSTTNQNEFIAVTADANASVDFGTRVYSLDITNFSDGPIGALDIKGEFIWGEFGNVDLSIGQYDGVKQGDFVILDQQGNVLGTYHKLDAVGDYDLINFVGPDAKEIMGHPTATIKTSVGGNRTITIDGAYLAKQN